MLFVQVLLVQVNQLVLHVYKLFESAVDGPIQTPVGDAHSVFVKGFVVHVFAGKKSGDGDHPVQERQEKKETVNVNPTHECMYVVVVGTLTWWWNSVE